VDWKYSVCCSLAVVEIIHLSGKKLSVLVIRQHSVITIESTAKIPYAQKIRRDNNLPPADLWRRAVNRGHHGAMLRPMPAMR